MTKRAIDLALKKQRLQIDSAALREQMAEQGRGIEPLFTAADLAREGWLWLRARPMIPVAIGVAFVVARPAFVWRWGRRAWLGAKAWQRWRKLAATAESSTPRR